MTPSACETYAINLLTPYVKRGDDLKAFLTSHKSGCAPACADHPTVYYSCGGTLYLNKDGNGASVKLKREQVGVIFYFDDGHSEFNVFDIPTMWDEIKHPVQLELWPGLK